MTLHLPLWLTWLLPFVLLPFGCVTLVVYTTVLADPEARPNVLRGMATFAAIGLGLAALVTVGRWVR